MAIDREDVSEARQLKLRDVDHAMREFLGSALVSDRAVIRKSLLEGEDFAIMVPIIGGASLATLAHLKKVTEAVEIYVQPYGLISYIMLDFRFKEE